MEDQKSRINRFLNELVNPNLHKEEQVTVFSQDENKDAAGVYRTNSICRNNSLSTCGGATTTNKECTNYDSYCADSKNYSCTAEASRNSSIMTCGGGF